MLHGTPPGIFKTVHPRSTPSILVPNFCFRKPQIYLRLSTGTRGTHIFRVVRSDFGLFSTEQLGGFKPSPEHHASPPGISTTVHHLPVFLVTFDNYLYYILLLYSGACDTFPIHFGPTWTPPPTLAVNPAPTRTQPLNPHNEQ